MIKKILLCASILALVHSAYASNDNPELEDKSDSVQSQLSSFHTPSKFDDKGFYEDMNPEVILQKKLQKIVVHHRDPRYSANWGNLDWVMNHYKMNKSGVGDNPDAFYKYAMGGKESSPVNEKYKAALSFTESFIFAKHQEQKSHEESFTGILSSRLNNLENQEIQTSFVISTQEKGIQAYNPYRSIRKQVYNLVDGAADLSESKNVRIVLEESKHASSEDEHKTHYHVIDSLLEQEIAKRKSRDNNISKSAGYDNSSTHLPTQLDEVQGTNSCCIIM